MQNVERILVLRPDGIGDALNSTPAISALRSAYPKAHISMALKPPGAEIMLLNPHIDDIIIYNAASLRAKLGFLKQLRSKNFDMAIVLRDSAQCNFMAYASGARYRLGRNTKHKRFRSTLTHRVEMRDPKGTKHEVDRNMDVVRLAGATETNEGLILELSVEEREWARDFLKIQNSKTEALLVGIHPGGSSYDKLWPVENFACVADTLVEQFGAQIMLFSGPDENHLIEGIKSEMKHPVISASGIELRQSAALIGSCSLFVCNDSGPMHISAALETPTAAIFGPTDYVRWRPYSKKSVIVKLDMDCWPCSAHKCKRQYKCIKLLPASDVLEAAYPMLEV